MKYYAIEVQFNRNWIEFHQEAKHSDALNYIRVNSRGMYPLRLVRVIREVVLHETKPINKKGAKRIKAANQLDETKTE